MWCIALRCSWFFWGEWDTVCSIFYCVASYRNRHRIVLISIWMRNMQYICVRMVQHVVLHCAVAYFPYRIAPYGIMLMISSRLLQCIISNCIRSHQVVLFVFVSFLGVLPFPVTFDIKTYNVLTLHVPPSRTASPHSKALPFFKEETGSTFV